MTSSRYVRPRDPSRLVLQDRDRAVLRDVYVFRYLKAEHIARLTFAGSSVRVAQARLRKLWVHQFLDRYYQPFVLTGPGSSTRIRTPSPIYSLTRQGAELVAEDLGIPIKDIPHSRRQNAVGFATLEHHLLAIEYLVAVMAVCRDADQLHLVACEPEHTLRRKLKRTRKSLQLQQTPLMPDGSITLQHGSGGRALTFELEVVRADVRGGNAELLTKMRRYLELLRSGYFRDALGHEHVRAVVFVTTSATRRDHLRDMARRLTHGRRLFWFHCFSPETVANPLLAPVFTADGTTTFGDALRQDPERHRAQV